MVAPSAIPLGGTMAAKGGHHGACEHSPNPSVSSEPSRWCTAFTMQPTPAVVTVHVLYTRPCALYSRPMPEGGARPRPACHLAATQLLPAPLGAR